MDKAEVRDYLRATSGVKGWFFPIDAALFGAVDEIQKREGVSGNLFEIGVHHGKATVLLARMKREGERLGACDIFENQGLNRDASGKGDKEVFLTNMHTHGRIGDGDLKVFAKSSEELTLDETTENCRFFHVDGGHWAEIVVNDMMTADRALIPEGIMAVDDVFNPNWPGVGEGFYQFMRYQPGKFVPVLIGANKVFLARPEFAKRFRKYCMPPDAFEELVYTGPFSFEDKEWMGADVLTVIRHSWVDLSPVRAALSHFGEARGAPLKEMLRR
jgi:hypothetical protein